MAIAAELAQAEARIARLEEALAEYALHYGLTERARALFREAAPKWDEAAATYSLERA
jgi:hypothetical protein